MNKAFSLLTIAAALALLAYTVDDYQACRAVGGEYVRGLFWFECVKPADDEGE